MIDPDPDVQFFLTHPDRQVRIRLPSSGRVEVSRRGEKVLRLAEEELSFRKLGGHDPLRRRILVWRVPADNPHCDPIRRPLLKIPFLAFADETIADDDAALLPIIHQIMMQNA